jgi:hypothetical protein
VDRNTEVVAEEPEHYTMQKRPAESGLWVYDFALPALRADQLALDDEGTPESNGDEGLLDEVLSSSHFLKCSGRRLRSLQYHKHIRIWQHRHECS